MGRGQAGAHLGSTRRRGATIGRWLVLALALALIVGVAWYHIRQRAAEHAREQAAFTNCSYKGAKPISEEYAVIPKPPAPGVTPKFLDHKVTLYINGAPVSFELIAKNAPCAVASFVHLAGGSFYDGTECSSGSAVGDLAGTAFRCGMGTDVALAKDPPYRYARETVPQPAYGPGTLAIWHEQGDTTNSGQLLIFSQETHPLDSYTVIGHVVSSSMEAFTEVVHGVGPATGPVRSFQVRSVTVDE